MVEVSSEDPENSTSPPSAVPSYEVNSTRRIRFDPEKITADELTEIQALKWLIDNEELWRNFSMPALVKREIERVIEQNKARTS